MNAGQDQKKRCVVRRLGELINKNAHWASDMAHEYPDFFPALAKQQHPDLLWIGCADSRVSADTIVGLLPGELFVHRNVANQVVATDVNCMAVVQFAVEVLKVEEVLICGHYNCGGVRAATGPMPDGYVKDWIQPIVRLRERYAEHLAELETEADRLDRLCELNVIEQVRSLSATPILRDAWERGQSILVHGVIYGLCNGILHNLDTTVGAAETVDGVCDAAVERLRHLGVEWRTR